MFKHYTQYLTKQRKFRWTVTHSFLANSRMPRVTQFLFVTYISSGWTKCLLASGLPATRRFHLIGYFFLFISSLGQSFYPITSQLYRSPLQRLYVVPCRYLRSVALGIVLLLVCKYSCSKSSESN